MAALLACVYPFLWLWNIIGAVWFHQAGECVRICRRRPHVALRDTLLRALLFEVQAYQCTAVASWCLAGLPCLVE